MIPELVGRFPVLVPFESLDEQQLVRVLREPHNSLLQQAAAQFRMDDVKLVFTEDALRAVAAEAVQRKTGARALRSIVERVLLDAKFECPGSDVLEVVVDEAAVRGRSEYRARRRTSPAQPVQDGHHRGLHHS